MKFVPIAGLLLGLLVPFAWAGPGAEAVKLGVDGLGCPFCAYGIEKTLGSLEGVDKVEVDIVRGEVVVTLANGATFDREAAERAVTEAGFTLRSFARVTEGQGG